jgi:nucleoside-diphosphate-sugar epimerase
MPGGRGSPNGGGSATKRCLITGGFGFLGSHLVELLLAGGTNQVHVIDDLRSSPLPLDVLLQEFPCKERLTYEVTSVMEYCARQKESPFDEIYHLASPVGPAGVLPLAGSIAQTIINDAMTIAGHARASGAVLVYVSSSEVYGGGDNGRCSESMPSLVRAAASPRGEYAIGKLAAETALLNYSAVHGLDLRIIRPFNVAGPRQSGRGGFVLPRFIGQALAGQPLTVFGDGKQRRAFGHVQDIVGGILCAARRGRKGDAYNIGNPQNLCTVLDLAEEVRAVTRSSSKITLVDPKKIYGPSYSDSHDKYPDLSRSEQELGWKPALSRRRAIEDTYGYMSAAPEPVLMALRGF